MFKTIAYLKIPCFHLQLYALFYPQQIIEPLAVGGSVDNYGIIMETSGRAHQKGVRANMLSQDACQLLPELKIVPPDNRRYQVFLKKITGVFDRLSLKWIKDKYNAFFLFWPDHFDFPGNVEALQQRIKYDFSISTRIGVSRNKYMARLAGDICRVHKCFFIDLHNSEETLAGVGLEFISELTAREIEALHFAGVQNVYDLFQLDLYHLRFFLGDKAELLYYNYICQLKTIRDDTQFIYEEVTFFNTTNHLQMILKTLKEKIQAVITGLILQEAVARKFKIYVEYVDNKNYIFTKKLFKKNMNKEIMHFCSAVLFKLQRRVRIKKIGLFFQPVAADFYKKSAFLSIF